MGRHVVDVYSIPFSILPRFVSFFLLQVSRGWDRALGRVIAYLFMRRRCALVYFPPFLCLSLNSFVTLFIFRSRSTRNPVPLVIPWSPQRPSALWHQSPTRGRQVSAVPTEKKNPTNANPNTESRTAPFLVKAYLVAYNLLSAAGWSFVLYRTFTHLFGDATAKPSTFIWVPSLLPASLTPFYTRACTTYDAVGTTTAYVQSGAVLEVLHVLLGLVRSPLPTTLVQVSSRLFSVWIIAARFPSVRFSLPSDMDTR